MDLIYSTPDKKDIGILKDYDFDLAYGVGENDFSLKLSLDAHCLDEDYLIYMVDTSNGVEEPTEYGGIVDAISVDTAQQTVTYTGRTWHGVLAGKVIEPEPGQDYRIVTGDAHEIIAELLSEAGLAMFTVEQGNSAITIPEYQFARYTDLYSGLCAMLSANGGKLQVRYQDKMAVLSAVWLVDYSQDDEWDSSQVNFSITKVKNPVNHLVCLGQGDLKDRYVIHLFADENGGVQPYTFTDNPVKDEDYILDKRNQVLFGIAEVAETYDYASAETLENYVQLTNQPDDWVTHYEDYFTSGDDGFEIVEGIEIEEKTALTTKPSNWERAYSGYVTANGQSVEGVTVENYVRVTKKPSDWNKNWSDYFVHFWDGVQWYWNHVDSLTRTDYEKQTKRPSDWMDNYRSYYTLKAVYKEVKNKSGKVIKKSKVGVGYARVDAVKKGKKEVAPRWKKGKYYTGYSYSVAPKFDSGLAKYRMEQTTAAPPFVAGRYYSLSTLTVAPPWKSGTFYAVYEDHFSELVKYGMERLQEEAERGDAITINLSLLGEYDVGDIVGASENVTGIEVWQPITKKIVNVKDNTQTITYEIGAKE